MNITTALCELAYTRKKQRMTAIFDVASLGPAHKRIDADRCIREMQTFWKTAALISLLYLSLISDFRATESYVGVSKGARFKCFICHWIENGDDCGDEEFRLEREESGRYMINCTACYKKVKRTSSGEKKLILRGCDLEYPHYDLKCQYFYYSDRSFEETCTCASEYCNGGDSTIRSRGILLVASAVSATIFGSALQL